MIECPEFALRRLSIPMPQESSPIKIAIFDADGVTTSPKKFSVDLEKDFGTHPGELLPFFKGPFQDCLLGKTDLKIAIEPYLKDWGWMGTAEEFLMYWFKSEDETNGVVVNAIKELRKQGVKCYLATNQEKYRTAYMRENMNFKSLFDGIYASADLGCKKPTQLFYERLLERIDPNKEVPAHEILFWDDVEANVNAAKEMDIRAYLYTDEKDFSTVTSKILEELS